MKFAKVISSVIHTGNVSIPAGDYVCLIKAHKSGCYTIVPMLPAFDGKVTLGYVADFEITTATRDLIGTEIQQQKMRDFTAKQWVEFEAIVAELTTVRYSNT